MMLHRHFENDYSRENMTKSADNASCPASQEEFVSAIFPPEEKQEEKKTRGRKKASE